MTNLLSVMNKCLKFRGLRWKMKSNHSSLLPSERQMPHYLTSKPSSSKISHGWIVQSQAPAKVRYPQVCTRWERKSRRLRHQGCPWGRCRHWRHLRHQIRPRKRSNRKGTGIVGERVTGKGCRLIGKTQMAQRRKLLSWARRRLRPKEWLRFRMRRLSTCHQD